MLGQRKLGVLLCVDQLEANSYCLDTHTEELTCTWINGHAFADGGLNFGQVICMCFRLDNIS